MKALNMQIWVAVHWEMVFSEYVAEIKSPNWLQKGPFEYIATPVSNGLTFVVDEEGVRGQWVLVVGDVLQDVRQVHIHPDHAQEKVAEITRPAHGHNETWRKKKSPRKSVAYTTKFSAEYKSSIWGLSSQYTTLLSAYIFIA